MNKDILIFGKGFIGQRIRNSLGCAITNRRISRFSDVVEEVERYNPRIIINCIGYTGEKSVDDCESDKDKTLFANCYVPLILAEVALREKIKLIHIGSDSIYHFDYKRSPLTEIDEPNFFELYYSRTKIYIEKSLVSLAQRANVLILRIRYPLDTYPHPKNILNKLLSFRKIVDNPNSITYLPDFIEMLKHLIKIDARGIYNTVNRGTLKYSKLLDLYNSYSSSCHHYEIVRSENLGKVRTNLILSTKKLEQTGFKIRNINEVLDECIKKYLQSK